MKVDETRDSLSDLSTKKTPNKNEFLQYLSIDTEVKNLETVRRGSIALKEEDLVGDNNSSQSQADESQE